MLARLLRQILFNLVHLVLTVLVAVKNVYRRFSTKEQCLAKDEGIRAVLGRIRTTAHERLKNVPHLRKKLKHLVMLANTDHHNLGDLASIIIWSLIVGVPYVSLYDVTGDLKQNEENLFLEVERRKKGIPGFIKWSKMPDLNGYTNGTQAHRVTVNIFSQSDGRPKIAQCIRDIASGVVLCESGSSELTAEELDKVLSLVYPSIPDPDLVIYTGPLCCTNGLLPWHIRLTEFVQLSVDNIINVESFLGALYKYNKCDQRFGK